MTSTDSPASGIRRAGAIMLLAGLSSASLACAPAIATQLARELGYGPADIGLFFSAEFTGFVVSGLAGQWLMPRFSWQRIAFWSLIGFLAGTVASAFLLHSPNALLAVRALTASCGTMVGVICMASANEDSNPGRALGFYIIGQLAIGVVGLAVLPLLFERFGYVSYLVTVALLLVLTARLTGWLASGKRTSHAVAAKTGAVKLRRPFRLLRIPVLTLFYIALGGIWTFAGDLATRAGLDPLSGGTILSVATFAGVLGAGVASLLGSKVDTRTPVLIGYCLLVASAVMFVPEGRVVEFVVAVLAFKFAWTFVLPFVFAIIGQLDEDGRIIAEIYLVAGIGLMTGPSIAGQLIAAGGGYTGMLIAESLLTLISGICLWILRRELSVRSTP